MDEKAKKKKKKTIMRMQYDLVVRMVNVTACSGDAVRCHSEKTVGWCHGNGHKEAVIIVATKT